MANWISLQETADKTGVRKGTLCMWRNRRRFPFKTRGNGRGLQVDEASVDAWMAERKEHPPKTRGRRAKAAVGKARGRGRRPGRPRKLASAPGRGRSCVFHVKGRLDLEMIQRFLVQVKSGRPVQVAPVEGGFVIRTVG